MDIGPFEGLRTIFVTGAIFTPPMFEWTQDAFGKHVHLMSTSGGTDICAGCKWTPSAARPLNIHLSLASVVVGVSTLPVHSGGIYSSGYDND